MCFNSTIFARKRTATKAIVCYKVVNKLSDTECSPPVYVWCSYIIGKNAPDVVIKKKKGYLWSRTIEDGYHSYKTLKGAERWSRDYFFLHIKVLAVFEIPKGADYYQNIHGQYVSSSIVFKGYAVVK